MNSVFCFTSGARLCAGLVLILLLPQSVLGFFAEPNPLTLLPGGTGVVRVRGSSSSAKVVLNTVLIADGSVTVSDHVGSESGTGFVDVAFTGLAAGTTSVTFIGTNKERSNPQPVQVSDVIFVTVLDDIFTSAQVPQVATAGDPVNTSTGEYFGSEGVDLNLGGPMPLLFSRYVASGLASDGLADTPLGPNRLHNFASKIKSTGATIKEVVLPDGRVLRFEKAATKWVLRQPLDVPYVLIESGGEFLLGHPHTKQIWTYTNTNPGRLVKIEDGRGNSHTLTYNGSGQLTGVADGLGRSLALTYVSGRIATVTGQPGARQVIFTYTGTVLTSATDQGGHVTQYGNNGGLPTSVTRPEGNTLFTQIYTGGKVTSQTERGTDTSTLDYGAGTTTFTDPTGETIIDNYTDCRLTSHVDQEGKAIIMTHDAAGRRNSITDRLGDKTTTVYHAPSGLPAIITNAEGKSTTMAYKARTLKGIVFHDLIKITYPDGTSRSFTYDAKGNVTKLTDQAGKSWSFTYNNTRGQILTVTNPLGGMSTYTYDDATGNLASMKDHDTEPTAYGYDARNRVIQIAQPGAANINITYDAKDRIATITDENGNTYTYSYDTNNRAIGIADPDTNSTTLAYDVLDRVTQITNRLGNANDIAYDSRGLIASITDANSNTTTFDYDSRQRLTGITNPGGQQSTIGYDDEGLPTSFATPVDNPSTIKRNHLGQPIEVRNPLGHTTLLTRDAMQRVTRVFDPVGRQVLYGYDKRGLLISVSEQGTGAAKYDRDGLGALAKITDPVGGGWAFTYTKGGRLASVTDPLGRKTSHSYDSRGRLEVSSLPDISTLTRTYDPASNLTGINYSSGPALTFGYDDLKRLTNTNGVNFSYDAEARVTNAVQNGLDFDATYDDAGRLVTAGYLDGAVTVTYGYDTRNRLTRVTDDQTTVQIDFAYDAANRLIGITRSNGVNGVFTYDGAGRLTRIEEGVIIDLQYALNAAGEVSAVDFTAPVVPAMLPAAQSLKFDKASRIIAPGYVYDLRGRLTAAPGGHSYTWDGASRLIAADGVTLEYNGLGDLARRVENAAGTRYYHHYALRLAPIVAEDPEGAGATQVYVWTPEGRLLYSFDLTSLQPRFYHFDRVGSTLALTDAAGAVTDAYVYGPYGETLPGRIGASPQPFTYVGQWGVRAEGSLYHMRARYYDPGTARFLSRDPIWPSITAPKRLNPYEYAAQSPGEFIDPVGTQERIAPRFDLGLYGGGAWNSSWFEDGGEGWGAGSQPIFGAQAAFWASPNIGVRITGHLPTDNDFFIGKPGGGGSPASDFFGDPSGQLFPGFPGSAPPFSAFPDPFGSLPPGFGFPPPFDQGIPFGDFPTFDCNGPDNSAGDQPETPSTAPLSQAQSQFNNMLLQHFYAIYRSLQSAWGELLNRSFDPNVDRQKNRDAMSSIDKAMKAIGTAIQAYGGTPPPPPM